MSNTPITSNNSALPPEIIHQIFHYACRISTGVAYNLCLVSSWARQFALPLLYSFVQIESQEKSALFLNTLKLPALLQPLNGPTQEDLLPTNWVTAIQFNLNNLAMFKIFDHCVATTGILCIAVNADSLRLLLDIYGYLGVYDGPPKWKRDLLERSYEFDIFVQTTIQPGLTRLWNPNNVYWSPYMKYGGISSICPLLDKITALRLPAFQPGELRHPPFPYVKDFVVLTHLAMPVEDLGEDSEAIRPLFEHPTLEVLVLVILKDRVPQTEEELKEWLTGLRNRSRKVRIYLAKSDSRSLVSDWEREQRGGRSIWDIEDS